MLLVNASFLCSMPDCCCHLRMLSANIQDLPSCAGNPSTMTQNSNFALYQVGLPSSDRYTGQAYLVPYVLPTALAETVVRCRHEMYDVHESRYSKYGRYIHQYLLYVRYRLSRPSYTSARSHTCTAPQPTPELLAEHEAPDTPAQYVGLHWAVLPGASWRFTVVLQGTFVSLNRMQIASG